MNKYKAFISYRHINPDMVIAQKLHTDLETYSIPKNIKETKGIEKVGRVFRDEEELPLSTDLGNDIEEALKDSEWLIVICTPELLESKWCMKEIDTFINLGKRDHILAVLVRGTPDKSFPKQLKEIEIDGQVIEIEPLAANVVADNINKSLKLLKNEKLRILAPLLGVSFDDLKQREQRRKTKRTYTILSLIILGFSLFVGYMLYKNNEIKNERNSALIAESKWLTKSANEALKLNNPTLSLELALEALPKDFKNPERPLVDETINTVYGAMFSKAQEGYKVVSTINLTNKKLNYFTADYKLNKLYLFEEKQDFIDVYSIDTGEYLETLTDKKSLDTTYTNKNNVIEKLKTEFDDKIENCFVFDYVTVGNQEKEGTYYYSKDYLIELYNSNDSINLIETIDDEIIHHYHYENEFVTYGRSILSFGSSFDGQFVYALVENNLVLFKASDEEVLKVLNYKDVGNFLFEEALISADKPLIAIRDKGGNGYIYNYLEDSFIKLDNSTHTIDSLQFNYDSSKVLVLNKTGNTYDIYSTNNGEMIFSDTADFNIDKVAYGRLTSYYGSTFADDLLILRGNGIYQILRCDVSQSNKAVTAVSNTLYSEDFRDFPLISNDGKTLWNYYFEKDSNFDIRLQAIDIETDTVINTFKTNHTYFKNYGGLIKGNYFINYYYYYDNGYHYFIDIYDATTTEILYSLTPTISLNDKSSYYLVWNLTITDDLKTIIMYVSDDSRNVYCLISLDIETNQINYVVNMKDINSDNKYINNMYLQDGNLVIEHNGYLNTRDISIVDINTGELIKRVTPEERKESIILVTEKKLFNFNNRCVYLQDGYLLDFNSEEELIYLGKESIINCCTDDGTKLVVSTVDRTSSSNIDSGAVYIINVLDNQSLIDSANKVLNGKTLSVQQRIEYFLD